jgi:hypothetical protein
MGGGTAVMLTMLLRDIAPEFADARCVAIACPACMTLELAASVAPFVTSVLNGTDIVPTFCSGKHYHCLSSHSLAIGSILHHFPS